jgi:hypothetical protein
LLEDDSHLFSAEVVEVTAALEAYTAARSAAGDDILGLLAPLGNRARLRKLSADLQCPERVLRAALVRVVQTAKTAVTDAMRREKRREVDVGEDCDVEYDDDGFESATLERD